MMKRPLMLLVTFFFIACSPNKQIRDFVITERNLIPEGTAFDKRTSTIYISSTFKRKIIQIRNDGSIEDFIPEKYEGIASVLGMEVDEERGILWVNACHANEVLPLKDPEPEMEWSTSLYSFDLDSKKIIGKFDLQLDTAFLNDLTITPNGSVFTTESVNGHLYFLNIENDSLELFLNLEGFDFLNGITYADEYKALFVASVQGIIRIDLEDKNYTLLETSERIDAGGIDGLTFFDNKLIGHQSSKVSMFYLNEKGTEIVKFELIDTGDEFDSSTTGALGNGFYYYIVNSQIRSGVDTIKKTIKPLDSLNNLIIRSIKL